MTKTLPTIVIALAAVVAATPCFIAREALAQPAAKDSAAKHKVVVYTEGQRASETKDVVLGTLPSTADVQTSEDFRKALAKQGQKVPFGLVITLPNKRQPVLKRIGKAVASMGAEAAIVGFIRPKKGGGREMLVLVVEADKEEPSIDQAITLDKPSTKGDVETALKDLIDAWKPAAAPAETTPEEKKDEEKKDEEKKDDEPSAPGERRANVYGEEIFHINASFDIGGRWFGYSDPITTNLRDYSVFGTPGISARAQVYPLAPLQIVVAKDIGIHGEFRIAPVISSETSDGTEVDTQWMRFGGGLQYRIPIPGPEDNPFVLALKGSFLREVFTMEATGAGAEALNTEVPSVAYSLMRVGLDGRFPIGPVAITAFGGYLGSIDSGAVYDRFREPSIGGIDVGGGLTVPIALGFEARLQAEYTRWFYAFAPVPGDAFVAGGALDEYVHLEIGPQYVY
ncbi:MAG: hypothetical protein JNL21_40800 [Myxococcales bacterium]|nr:hypothetical protein [Myxococcales bacterium]